MRRSTKRYALALILLIGLIALVAGPLVEQARRKLYPPHNYSRAAVRDVAMLTLNGHTRRVNRVVF
jgi:hypothetical protein